MPGPWREFAPQEERTQMRGLIDQRGVVRRNKVPEMSFSLYRNEAALCADLENGDVSPRGQ
jgi:hypothetical protein